MRTAMVGLALHALGIDYASPSPRNRPLRITRVSALPAYIPSTTWRRRRLELERTKRRQGRAS